MTRDKMYDAIDRLIVPFIEFPCNACGISKTCIEHNEQSKPVIVEKKCDHLKFYNAIELIKYTKRHRGEPTPLELDEIKDAIITIRKGINKR